MRVVEIPGFEAKASRRGIPEVDVRTGAADAWIALAQASSGFARKLSDMADKAAAKEGELAGMEAGMNFTLTAPDGTPAKTAAKGGGEAAPKDARERALAFYVGKGWTREQAAGIVGNLMQESGLDPKAIAKDDAGPGAHSEGIGQWNRLRLARLKEFGGANWQDFETQLAFVHHELTTTEAVAGAKLKAAKSVSDATAAMIGFERPQGWTPRNPQGGHGWENRLAHAQGLVENGTAAPAVAAPAALPLQVTPAEGGPPATIQPLVLTRGTSIRDQAFDRAALGTAADRLDVQAYQNLEAIAQKYPDQPEQALEAIEAYSASVKSQIKAPELVTRFDSIVARHRLGIVREAAEKSETKRKNDRQAAFLDDWSTRRTALVRLARRLPDGGDGDQAVAGELAEMEGLLGTAGQELTPKERLALKLELAQDVGTARIMAGFERITDPKMRHAYAQSFEEAWTKGEGKTLGLSPETFEAIRRDMQQVITRDRVDQERLVRETGTKVEQLINRLGKGYAVTPEDRAAIKASVEASGDPVLGQSYKFFDALASWQSGARLARPEALTATIAAEEARMNRDGATAHDIDALDAMKKLRDTIADGLKDDMLGTAERMNLTAVPPLDPKNFTQSLISRKATAETIATHYGREPQYFKPGEIEALTRAFAVDPDQLVGFSISLREAMGDKTPDALKQVSKQAPMLAHVAGIAFATKNDRLLREASEAMKRKAVEGYKPVKFPDAKKDAAIIDTLGPSLSRLPETQAAALETADMLFDLRAQAAGVDPASEEAKAIYEGALNDALGAEGTGGGVQDVNGVPTLLPAGRTGFEVEEALQNLTDADVARLPPIGSASGVPIRAGDLRNAKLVADGYGTYRVALGNPSSTDPRFLGTPSGAMWILRLDDLLRISRRALGPAGSPFGEFEMQGTMLGAP